MYVHNYFFIFLFFRLQGFRMMTFDRQAGPLQNFNRSHVMVIGRSVSFSDPARPPGGGVRRPEHPQNPPLPKKKNCVLGPQEDVFAEKKFQLLKTWCSDQYTYMSCPLTIYNNSPAGSMHIYAYNTLGYHHLFRSRTLLIIDYLMQWPIYLHELCAFMCLSW